MITITQITSDNESKLMGEVDDFSYCITYNKTIHKQLEELSAQIDLCVDFDEWTGIIEKAKTLVTNKPFIIKNSKYFVKINDEFFLSNGKKYYNIVDSKNIIKNTLNYYNDKGLSIDKFAKFISRNGDPKLLQIKNVYHKLNNNGNIRGEIYGDYYISKNRFDINNNKVILRELPYQRYFLNNTLIESNKLYTLKELGSSLNKIKFDEKETIIAERILPVLIKPDLKCYTGDLEEGGLLLDPDDEIDWDSHIISFIDKHGSER